MRLGKIKIVFPLFVLLILITSLSLPVYAQSAPIVLQLGVSDFEAELIFNDQFVSHFEEQNPGIKLQIVSLSFEAIGGAQNADTPEEYFEALQKLVGSADVIAASTEQLSQLATRAGFLLDLTPLVSADPDMNAEDFLPAAWQAFQWDRGIWGIPVSTNIIAMGYYAEAFDQAGVAYPNANWTIDDLAIAARALAQRDADNKITAPGLTYYNPFHVNALFRSLLSSGLYDSTTAPETPHLALAELEHILTVWAELVNEGAVGTPQGGIVIGGDSDPLPLSLGGSFVISGNPFNPNAPQPVASVLPGGRIVADVSGYAVNATTQFPEAAYTLLKYLANAPEVANGAGAVSPARRSLAGVEAPPLEEGGGGQIVFSIGGQLSAEVQAFVDNALESALAPSELRNTDYISEALKLMADEGLDAHSALLEVEAKAVADLQLATAYAPTNTLSVPSPKAEVVLAPGEIALSFGLQSFIFPLPNEDDWQRVIDDFVAAHPQVGKIDFKGSFSQNIEANDCYVLPFNDVPGRDLSTVLSLDPFLNSDPTFDPNDVVGNLLTQVQRDNRTWALPINLNVSTLDYNSVRFAQSGVPEPVNGWDISAFEDALRRLQENEGKPPLSLQPGGSTTLLILMAAYGGLPLDFRTDPVTINFTDPATVAAIRQVLDLARAGYIDYTALAAGGANFVMAIGGDSADDRPTISPSLPLGDVEVTIGGGQQANPYRSVAYPTGSQYSAVSFNMGVGYINAASANPEACYSWLSTIAQHPELFNGMPVRRSLINSPALTASQGANSVALYQQLDSLLQKPNTLIMPSLIGADSFGGFLFQYWLNKAFDAYVLDDADLESALADSQALAQAFQQCVANLPPFDPTATDAQTYNAQVATCARTVDPETSSFFPESN